MMFLSCMTVYSQPVLYFVQSAQQTIVVIIPFVHLINPISHLKFLWNIRISVKNWDLFGLDIGKINNCGIKMATRCHLKIELFSVHKRGGFSRNSNILQASVRFWLTGRTSLKNFWWSGTLIMNTWCVTKIVKSVLTIVYYQGIFLDGKVNNLV